jgi:hypothetical protein
MLELTKLELKGEDIMLKYTKHGYNYVEVTDIDCFMWGGHAVCDHCNANFKKGYLVYVLNAAICGDCFDYFVRTTKRFPSDLKLQQEHSLAWYKRHGKEVK